MSTSLRIMAILLGLLGLERIVYADVVPLLPGAAVSMPVLSVATGVAIVVASIGLFLGLGWSRWPSVIGAAIILLQGLAYVAWNLSRGLGPIALIIGLLEPLLAVLVIERLVRRWPPGVAWNERLR